MTNITTKTAIGLNVEGRAHVASELKRLSLDWCPSATASEIEDKPGFLLMGPEGYYEYEISSFAAGRNSYGAFAHIRIDPEHVTWLNLAADE